MSRIKKPNPSRGRSQYSSGASFAKHFSNWWGAQSAFKRHADLAAAIGASRITVRFWLAGRGFPTEPLCEKLYAITQLDVFGPGRDAARAEHQRRIPRQVKKRRREGYRALSLEKRAALGKAARAARRKFVSDVELSECRADVRKAKTIRGRHSIVCLECGQIYRDLSGHLGMHHMSEAGYKEKFGYNRGTSLRSFESGEKQGRSLKSSRHRTPARSLDYMKQAIQASRAVHKPGRARLEERLNRRGRRTGARPSQWKRTETGEVVTDAQVAALRLRGRSDEDIATSLGISLTAVYHRLRRMNFPRRARVFLHGEPVGAKHFFDLMSDFDLIIKDAAHRVGISLQWAQTLVRRGAAEWTSPRVAKRILAAREELTRVYRITPSAGERGGRPKRLTPSDERGLSGKYNALRTELKALRLWIREQDRTLSDRELWDRLCDQFRARKLRTVQFWPQFFVWVQKTYDAKVFRHGYFVPHELSIDFIAADYGVTESVIEHYIKTSHQNGPIPAEI